MGPDILLLLVAALIIILIWRGPAMLPRIGEALGRTVKNTRDEIPSALRGDEPGASDPGTGETGESRDT